LAGAVPQSQVVLAHVDCVSVPSLHVAAVQVLPALVAPQVQLAPPFSLFPAWPVQVSPTPVKLIPAGSVGLTSVVDLQSASHLPAVTAAAVHPSALVAV